MKTINPYTCVGCEFYDQLEILAMRKNQVRIIYKNKENKNSTIVTYIKTLQTRNKEEFIVTLSGKEIRLDKIVEVSKN